MDNITEEEERMIKSFRELGIKPKADTKEELGNWLRYYNIESVPPWSEDRMERHKAARLPSATSHTIPKISIFYGDTTTLKKGEVVYDQWRYEVEGLSSSENFDEDMLLQAVRRSVKGEASRVLMRLGADTKLEHILEKFDSVYGTIDTKEDILANFYSARQKEDEDITAWSCRLEDLICKAVDQHLVKKAEANEMLCSMIWTGMKPDFKRICGYKVEQITEFNELRVALRKLEKEHRGQRDMTARCNTVQESELRQEVNELKGALGSITSSLKEMKEEIQNIVPQCGSRQGYFGRRGSNSRGNRGYRRGQYRDSGPRYQRDSPREKKDGQDVQKDTKPESKFYKGIYCFKCRQEGHYQWNCRIRDDHLN